MSNGTGAAEDRKGLKVRTETVKMKMVRFFTGSSWAKPDQVKLLANQFRPMLGGGEKNCRLNFLGCFLKIWKEMQPSGETSLIGVYFKMRVFLVSYVEERPW